MTAMAGTMRVVVCADCGTAEPLYDKTRQLCHRCYKRRWEKTRAARSKEPRPPRPVRVVPVDGAGLAALRCATPAEVGLWSRSALEALDLRAKLASGRVARLDVARFCAEADRHECTALAAAGLCLWTPPVSEGHHDAATDGNPAG